MRPKMRPVSHGESRMATSSGSGSLARLHTSASFMSDEKNATRSPRRHHLVLVTGRITRSLSRVLVQYISMNALVT
jgi:hypothetical protein